MCTFLIPASPDASTTDTSVQVPERLPQRLDVAALLNQSPLRFATSTPTLTQLMEIAIAGQFVNRNSTKVHSFTETNVMKTISISLVAAALVLIFGIGMISHTPHTAKQLGNDLLGNSTNAGTSLGRVANTKLLPVRYSETGKADPVDRTHNCVTYPLTPHKQHGVPA